MAQSVRDGNCITGNHVTMNDSSMSGYAAIVICSISAAIKLLMLYIMLSFSVKFERKHLKNAA